jgi:Skp1 family, tetramerisation domain
MAEEGMVTLSSNDNEIFKVDEKVAFLSITVKNMIEDTGKGMCMHPGFCSTLHSLDLLTFLFHELLGNEQAVPLPNVASRTLAKVLQYNRKHVEAAEEIEAAEENARPKLERDLEDWDKVSVSLRRPSFLWVAVVATAALPWGGPVYADETSAEAAQLYV